MKYTSQYIYINPQGVPCAPMKKLPKGYSVPAQPGVQFQWGKLDNKKEILASLIPIREEDRAHMFRHWRNSNIATHLYEETAFYEVEPYEFEVEEIETGQRIVKTNGYPTGHETYYEQVARIVRPEENIITECLSFKQVMDKLYTAYPKHRFILINENAKDPTDKGENEWIKSGHKAEVKSPLLTDEQIEEAAQNACRGIEDEDQLMYALKDFRRGAKMARDHYENRKS